MFVAQEAAAQGNIFQMLLPFIIMIAVVYFLLIRPNQKRQKTRNSMLQALRKGDKIVTIGGVHGTVTEITDDIIILRVNEGTKLTFDRSAVSSIVSSTSEANQLEN